MKTRPVHPTAPSSVSPHIILPIVASVVTVAYVAPKEEPSFSSVVVKLLPCLSLLYYIWLTQMKNTGLSSLQTLYHITGYSSTDSCSNRRGSGGSSAKKLAGDKENQAPRLQKDLIVGLTRGLVFSMIGDAFLVWHDVEVPFLLGMAAFGVAQACYIKGLGFMNTNWKAGALVYSLFVLLSVFLLSDAPALFRNVVPLYAALLATTLWRTIDRFSVPDGRSSMQQTSLFAGALVFAVSDACIALFKFVMQARPVAAQTIILSTYFAAQILLTVGVA